MADPNPFADNGSTEPGNDFNPFSVSAQQSPPAEEAPPKKKRGKKKKKEGGATKENPFSPAQPRDPVDSGSGAVPLYSPSSTSFGGGIDDVELMRKQLEAAEAKLALSHQKIASLEDRLYPLIPNWPSKNCAMIFHDIKYDMKTPKTRSLCFHAYRWWFAFFFVMFLNMATRTDTSRRYQFFFLNAIIFTLLLVVLTFGLESIGATWGEGRGLGSGFMSMLKAFQEHDKVLGFMALGVFLLSAILLGDIIYLISRTNKIYRNDDDEKDKKKVKMTDKSPATNDTL